jgi:hypothetical protein
MAGRAISEGRRAWLIGELAAWRQTGIVSDEQSARIEGFYETQGQSAERRVSRAVFTLMGVAAFLVGLAVLLLIGYNWESMPRPVKIGMVFAVVLSTYAAAFWTRYSRRAELPSELLFFLACIFYGCGIWLIGQAFHVQAHWPDGIWIWALGVLPFALCLDTLLLHALLVALLAIWVGAELIGFPGRIFWGLTINGAYSLPLLILPGMLWAYHKRSSLAIALYVPLAVWWAVLQPLAWNATEQSVYLAGAAGAALLLLAEAHKVGDEMAIPFRFWGTALATGSLIPLGFGDFIRELQRPQGAGTVTALAIALSGAVGIAALAFYHSTRNAGAAGASGGMKAFVSRQWFPVMMLVLMAFLALWNSRVAQDVPRYGAGPDRWSAAILLPVLATNAAMIALAFHLIRVGLSEDRGRPFSFGVLVFLAWATLRYVDLFSGVGGMLGAAVMFLLCGVSLFAVARFWQARKVRIHV